MTTIRKCFSKNPKGFTLTEILIGMMILTVAIVSSTTLLVGLLSLNKDISNTMKANYFAIEGVEAIRNIRDSNWMNNVDFLGTENTFGQLMKNAQYTVTLNSSGWILSDKSSNSSFDTVSTWSITPYLSEDDAKLCKFFDQGAHYYSSCKSAIGGEESGFSRVIEITEYCDSVAGQICKDSIMVISTVSWIENNENKSVQMSEILTNWKRGAL